MPDSPPLRQVPHTVGSPTPPTTRTLSAKGTSLSNRRQLFDVGGAWLEHAGDADCTLSVISLEVDHFKKLNAPPGHAVGDRALTVLVRVTREVLDATTLPEPCLLARVGGEGHGFAYFPAAHGAV